MRQATTTPRAETGYAPVNGLQMYYEVHGEGEPLVLLHGWYSNIELDFAKVLPIFAKDRRVIAIEQQGHGRTADIDRPFSYEQMADDTAALLRHLGVERADFVGYSGGGAVALEVARRHPELVRKFVTFGGSSYDLAGLYPEVLAGLTTMTPEELAEVMAGTRWGQAYARLAPNPEDFPTLVAKKLAHDLAWKGWPPETIRSITAPTMIIVGDADIVRPEHAVELFRLRGGGVPGDLTGLPPARLAILPGTTHVTIVDRAAWLTSMVTEFLDAPTPGAG